MKALQLSVGWALVGIPLLFGIYQTLTKVTALFS
ncbi:hypothetical protein RCH23_001785 [Cryobacterium sp. CAN_C3]|nr:hypothetical protein [Cryobacterium sp. CAN_C3]